MTPRLLCWFSCGAASAVMVKKAIDRYSHSHTVLIVNCDTRKSEHPDNYRFCTDCENWWGQKIIHLRNENYDTVDDVFEKHRYLAGIMGARCTTELKKIPRLRFAEPDDYHAFGFTLDEGKRCREFCNRNPELRLLWPLVDAGYNKSMCYEELRDAGIPLPAMYALGFSNNNCPGCVKASSPWYWQMVRKHFPDVFERRCKQSRELNVRLVKIGEQRIFLDELPNKTFKKSSFNENLSCGPECGGPPVQRTLAL